jgi:hypothetical protein
MPNGDPGLPNSGELPGDEPPPYIEGPTGGPAMPTGGGGAWTKEGAEDYLGDMRTMMAVSITVGGMAFVAGSEFRLRISAACQFETEHRLGSVL